MWFSCILTLPKRRWLIVFRLWHHSCLNFCTNGTKSGKCKHRKTKIKRQWTVRKLFSVFRYFSFNKTFLLLEPVFRSFVLRPSVNLFHNRIFLLFVCVAPKCLCLHSVRPQTTLVKWSGCSDATGSDERRWRGGARSSGGSGCSSRAPGTRPPEQLWPCWARPPAGTRHCGTETEATPTSSLCHLQVLSRLVQNL